MTANGAQAPASANAPHVRPISVVVFSDFECPFSADLFFSLEKYEKNHPGQIHVTFKQSPLTSIHPGSPAAHRAALAAAKQGRFNEMAELLYANQKRQETADVLSYARQLHLDMLRFRRDLNSTAIEHELAADMDESSAFKVDATPTMYIAGKSFIGEQTDRSLAAVIAAVANQQLPDVVAQSQAQTASLDADLLAEIQRNPTAERGNAGAPLTIIEFSDFQCPFCKLAAQPMEEFIAAHGRDVHWILRSFPLDFHPDSELANEAALAAGEQGKFWQMHDLLFAHQDALKLPNLREYATDLHLDMAAFDEALATHRLAGKIAADRALGVKAGVDGTPTFVIDGQASSGAHSVVELEQLLADHKAKPEDKQKVVAAVVTPEPERRVSGLVNSPLTLTWFTDVRSPLAAMQAELVRSLAKRYNDKIRVVVKVFPLESHPDGRLGSYALVAASAQGKFWPMYDALTAHKDTLDRDAVIVLAGQLQLDAKAFIQTLNTASEFVQKDMDEAQRRGVLGTPVIFLNDKRVDGLQREAFYTAIADQELKQVSDAQVQLSVPTSLAR
jgi:protein-disulfide isomerase